MGAWPPWWTVKPVGEPGEGPPPPPPPVEAVPLLQHEAQQLAAVQNGMDATEIASALGLLLPLLFMIIAFYIASGFGSPHRGGGFHGGSRGLREDAAGRLQSARPTAWSGARGGGADNYSSAICEQQARVQAIAQLDLQVADIVEIQADQVEQGRQELEIIIYALIGGIAVAEVMEMKWRAAAAVLSPAAPAIAAALLTFARTLACTTCIATLHALETMVGAGFATEQALIPVIDQYQEVVDDVAAKLPTGWAPSVPASTGAAPQGVVGEGGPERPYVGGVRWLAALAPVAGQNAAHPSGNPERCQEPGVQAVS